MASIEDWIKLHQIIFPALKHTVSRHGHPLTNFLKLEVWLQKSTRWIKGLYHCFFWTLKFGWQIPNRIWPIHTTARENKIQNARAVSLKHKVLKRLRRAPNPNPPFSFVEKELRRELKLTNCCPRGNASAATNQYVRCADHLPWKLQRDPRRSQRSERCGQVSTQWEHVSEPPPTLLGIPLQTCEQWLLSWISQTSIKHHK